MIILDATTKSLEAVLAGAVTTNQLPIVVTFVDVTTTTYVPGATDTVTNNTTGVTVVAAPAASTQRQVKLLTVFNADTVAATATVRYNNNGTLRTLCKVTLVAGSTLVYTDGEGWRVLDTTGGIVASQTVHHTTHESGGSDAIKLDDLAAPDDNTDLDASTSKHGLLKKLPGDTTTFLRADGSFASPNASPTEQTTSATGTQNNFDLNAHFTYLRCSGAAPSFTGFTVLTAAPTAGDRVIIENVDTATNTVKCADENASSTAANRFTCPSVNGQIIGAKGRMELVYDGTSSRWRVECVDPGLPITWTPVDSSGASLTFTGVSAFYTQHGRVVSLQWELRYPSTANGSASAIGGFPFAASKTAGFALGFVTAATPMYLYFNTSGPRIDPVKQAGGANMLNSDLSLAFVWGSGTYFAT